jgi:hypothetical protein
MRRWHYPTRENTTKSGHFRAAIWLTLAIVPLFIAFVVFWVAPKIALLQAHEAAAVSPAEQSEYFRLRDMRLSPSRP